MDHLFSFVSHLEGGMQSEHPVYRVRSIPAYLNQEFNLQIPLMQQLKLKAEDVFSNRRKAELLQLIVDMKPDVILLDNFNYTDALMADKRGMTQKTI